MQISYSPIIINFFLFIICLEMVFYLIERLLNAKFAKEKNEQVKSLYPDLSKKELKLRNINLANYFKIHLNSSFTNSINTLSILIFLVSMAATLLCAIFDHFSGLCFSLGLMLFFMSIFALNGPSFQKQQTFMKKYLTENPDNPLMVVPTTIEPKHLKLIKFWKFNAFFRIFCAGYAFYVGFMLYQLNL